MIIVLKIEKGKDKSGKMKRVLWVSVDSQIEGIGKFGAMPTELKSNTPLAKEVDWIVKELLTAKKADIKEKNKAKITKLKKKNA